jgi:hypothetical protein
MRRSLKAISWTIIDSFAVSTPIPADLTANNDNNEVDDLARDVLDILLSDRMKMLAG